MIENNHGLSIDIEGTHNFRDVGGLKASGGEIKRAVLYRSDALNKLTTAGKQKLQGLGVKRAIDLRDDRERAKAPDDLPAGVELFPLPIFPDALAHIDQKLDISGLTELIFLQHPKELVTALNTISERADPVVVHCTAGKDRTGAVIALTLSSLGVEHDDILHDYSLTEVNLRGEWLERHIANLQKLGMELTPEVLGLIGSSPIPVLDRALKTIDREFGSISDYLFHYGLKESTLESLHVNLVSNINNK